MINDPVDVEYLNDSLDKATDMKFTSPSSAIAIIKSILGLAGMVLPDLPNTEGEYYFKVDDVDNDAYLYIVIDKDFDQYEAFAAIIDQDEYEDLQENNV